MILDLLDNVERLRKVHPGFGPALKFLRETDLGQLAAGRVEIDGERLYAVTVRGDGKGQRGAKLEAHRRYIDIQYSFGAPDVIGWKHLAKCLNPAAEYDAQKDLQFFQDAPDSWVTIPRGSFGIYFPEDAHAPMASEGPISKVVVKVLVDWQ